MPGAPIKLATARRRGTRRAPGAHAGAAPRRSAAPGAHQRRPPRRAAARQEVITRRSDHSCFRASSSTARSSRRSSRSSSCSPASPRCARCRSRSIPEIAPPVVTVQAVYPGRLRRGARADRRRAARERDQRRREHDLHELELGVERRRADPGHVRDRHQRRQGGDQRQQPRQAGRAAAAGGSAPPGRDGREAARRRSCRCSRSTRPTAASTTCSRRTT